VVARFLHVVAEDWKSFENLVQNPVCFYVIAGVAKFVLELQTIVEGAYQTLGRQNFLSTSSSGFEPVVILHNEQWEMEEQGKCSPPVKLH
jgi:hypothetical protein